MQSPDPGISLANIFTSRAPATPAAAPKPADRPRFEDSLSDAARRPDTIRNTERPTRSNRPPRAEEGSRVEPSGKPTEQRAPTDSNRNETSDSVPRQDDQAGSYARARLLIAEPVAKPQQPVEVAPVVVSQPAAEVGKNLRPVVDESLNPELPEAGSDSEDVIFHIQPWPLDSTTDQPVEIQPIVNAKATSVESISHPTIEQPEGETTPSIDFELPDQTTDSGPLTPGSQAEAQQPSIVPVQVEVDAPTSLEPEPVVTPGPPVTTAAGSEPTPIPAAATAAPQSVANKVQPVPETSKVRPAQQQQPQPTVETKDVVSVGDLTNQAQAPSPSESHPTAGPSEFTLEQSEPSEPSHRVDEGATDQRSFAEAVKRAETATQSAPPTQPQSTPVSTAGTVREATSAPSRAVDAVLAASGVAVTAVEEAGEGNTAGTGSQDFDGHAFSSLVQTAATQSSRSQRVTRQIELNPTQFAEMPGEIVARARTLADNETAELEIQLDPPELGQLKIQLRRIDGEVAARITVTDPAAFELLQTELQELRENLQQSDVAFGSVDVEQDQSNQQTFDREQSDSFAREDSEPAAREATPSRPTGSSQQTIDIRV